jgi:hypothetical protein
MPNWIEGTMKLRVKREDIRRFFLEGLDPSSWLTPGDIRHQVEDNSTEYSPDFTFIEDDPDTFPPVDEEGFSEYVLLSFSNAHFVCIGEYGTDLAGGAFYDGDDDRPLNSFGLIVNAWRPMPERFKREE